MPALPFAQIKPHFSWWTADGVCQILSSIFTSVYQIFLRLIYLLPAKIKYLWDPLHFAQIKTHIHWWTLVSLWSVVSYWSLYQTLWRLIGFIPIFLPLLWRTSAYCHYLGSANWTSCKTHFSVHEALVKSNQTCCAWVHKTSNKEAISHISTLLLLNLLFSYWCGCRKCTTQFLHCTMPQFSHTEPPPVKSTCMKLFAQRNLSDYSIFKICWVRWGKPHKGGPEKLLFQQTKNSNF